MGRLTLIIFLGIFVLGFWLRYLNIQPANLIFDYDQYEDLFYTYRLATDHKPLIIGRAPYGNANLHHGVFFFYYNLIPFLTSGGGVKSLAYWNSFFNIGSALLLFFLAKSLFKSTKVGLITSLIVAVSFEYIRFSSWLVNETVAFFTVPLFYLGLWQLYQKKSWGLPLTALGLGLAIQTDLFFLYLIPIFIFFLFLFRPEIPKLKTIILSTLIFLATTATMILTEIKLNFIGVKTLLNFSNTLDQAKTPLLERFNLFTQDFFREFALNLYPERLEIGLFIGAVILGLTIFFLYSKQNKKERTSILFLLFYLLSPFIVLFIGYHNKPWFLISLPPAIALLSAFVISRLRLIFILPILLIIAWSNVSLVLSRPERADQIFGKEYDQTSYLKYQWDVVDYTYRSSQGQSFAINAVTFPLYYNAMWAYSYSHYGKDTFGFMPGWAGGDQLHPYDLLPKSTGQEKYLYLIISETPRIPEIFKNRGIDWAENHGKLIEEKVIGGFRVQKLVNTH